MNVITATSRDLQSRAIAAGYDPAALDVAVLIVGMGALGQNTALDLALSGVRELRLVDADRFEAHNRTRSPLYPVGAGEGVPKAPSTAAALRDRMTHPHGVVRWADAWIEDLGAAAFGDVAVVVSCVDSMRARAHLSHQARRLRLPLVEGGFGGPDVTLGVYPAADDDAVACWLCGREALGETVSCRTAAVAAERAQLVPAIQSAAATLGGLQAEAVVEVLHGRAGDPRRVWLNIRSGEAVAAGLLVDPACAGTHHALPRPVQACVGVDGTVADLLDAVADRLDGLPTLDLLHGYLPTAPCARCERTMTVAAPSHRYERAPFCIGCGGRWPADAAASWSNKVPSITAGDPLAHAACGDVGLAPGDVVRVRAGREAVAARLRGGHEDLFEAAS
jgi:sulfur carrier protein ThiS adenylyltransferase